MVLGAVHVSSFRPAMARSSIVHRYRKYSTVRRTTAIGRLRAVVWCCEAFDW